MGRAEGLSGRGDLWRVMCAEVGSLAGVQATCGICGVSGDWLSEGILFYYKSNYGPAGRRVEHSTSRGSEVFSLLGNK